MYVYNNLDTTAKDIVIKDRLPYYYKTIEEELKLNINIDKEKLLSIKDNKKSKKILINNNLGLLGNLLYKYKEDIRRFCYAEYQA